MGPIADRQWSAQLQRAGVGVTVGEQQLVACGREAEEGAAAEVDLCGLVACMKVPCTIYDLQSTICDRQQTCVGVIAATDSPARVSSDMREERGMPQTRLCHTRCSAQQCT